MHFAILFIDEKYITVKIYDIPTHINRALNWKLNHMIVDVPTVLIIVFYSTCRLDVFGLIISQLMLQHKRENVHRKRMAAQLPC